LRLNYSEFDFGCNSACYSAEDYRISQHFRNDLYCVEWGVKLYSLTPALAKAQIPLGSSRHVRRVEPIHFGSVELVEQHGSTRRAWQAWLATYFVV